MIFLTSLALPLVFREDMKYVHQQLMLGYIQD